jgi:hypothetical protein
MEPMTIPFRDPTEVLVDIRTLVRVAMQSNNMAAVQQDLEKDPDDRGKCAADV